MRQTLVALITIALCAIGAQAAISQAQRDALLALYTSTSGDAWISHTGWNGAPGTECTWQGITCDGSQSNVTGILLSNNNLAGLLPAQIGNLSGLQQLTLSANKVTGPIPAELGRLTLLRIANLDSNAFSGTIPSELATLPALQRLDLRSNQLTGTIPPAIGQLAPTLTAFLVSNNQLTGTIDVLMQLTNLQFLGVDGNQFSGPIPSGIGALKALQFVEMGGNQFIGGIPDSLGSLPNLQGIDFTRANLSGPIPASLGQLGNLQFLTLSLNQLTGSIPIELGSLTKLQMLQLDRNSLAGPIPDSLTNLKNVVEFDAWNNALTGPIPALIGQMTSLRVLNLSSNHLSGSIPPSISQLVNLQRLDLEDNDMTGTLPTDIGNMKSLTDLRLNSDGLQGPIPPSIGDLASLQSLTLAHNELTGALPSDIGNLRQLLTLSVYDNELDGALPAELGNLSALQSLSLSANHFSGTIPKEIGALTQLQSIDLSLNALRGPVPVEIENLTSLSDHTSAFDHNLLFTTDAVLSAFLDRKQANGGQWALFQTVAPTNVRVVSITDRNATIAWDRILDIYSEGGYQVVASTVPGGSPVALATTSSKQLDSIVIRGLSPSTQYFFTVATVTHPIGLQKNLLISDPTVPVSATTTSPVLSPADVAVSSAPQGLVQIDGVAVNQDSFTLTNYGDSAANLTLVVSSGDFFSFTPAALTLGAGESQAVTLSSIVKPAGSYYGSLTVQGNGAGFSVFVALLSVARPAGTVSAEPVSTRVEVAGAPGSDIVGSAAYRNTGSAPLTGIAVSDADWVQPSNVPITIFPGQSATIPFTVVASKRPSNLGALSANLRLVYVAGTSAKGVLRALDNGSSGVAVSVVTVVATSKPPTSAANPPSLSAGELVFFVPGLVSLVQNGLTMTSDLSMTNISTATSLSDLRVFFTPAGNSNSTVASFNSISTETAVNLVNALSDVYGDPNAVGTLQMRSASLGQVSAFAKIAAARGSMTTIGDVPILRSDRSAKMGDVTVLTGIRGGADLYLQETSGLPASVQIDFLDASGAAAVASQTLSIPSLTSAALTGVVPATAVTAMIANNGPGAIGAYARITDASGDTWSIVDWRRIQSFDASSPLRIPFVHGAANAGGGRHRAVAHAVNATNQSDVTLFNPGTSAAIAHIDVQDTTGHATSRDITVAPHQTLILDNVAAPAAVAQLVITPARGDVYASCRDYHASGGGTVGAAVPVLASTSGLRLGQSRVFAGVEDPTTATIADAAPATYRSALGLVETSGQSASVRISVAISETASLATALIVQTINLTPNQQVILDPILRGLTGPGRDSAFGDLHGMKLQIDVISGTGSIVPFIVVTDNGSGDTYLRLE